MFFPEKIKSIRPTDRVLEVGPGGSPFPRSDVLLEKVFEDNEAHAQRGYANKLKSDKKIIFYHGERFPFEDNEFDYVICSHVLEHVPQNELNLFIQELSRVASKGYIEFPTAYYEVINYQDVHLWFMNYINNEIVFLHKEKNNSTFMDETLRKLFYSDAQNSLVFNRYKELFFIGFEWNKEIMYKVVDSFEKLDDKREWGNYFSQSKESEPIKPTEPFLKKVIRKISFILNAIMSKKEYKISKTAIIQNKNLVKLGSNVEIQDYVIIKTFENEVIIGANSQINPYTVIYGGVGVIIGENVMIAPHCAIAAGTHDFIQTKKPMIFGGNFNKGPIIIEDDVWIGANCTITDGVHIGKGAVVGANSVVTHNIKPYDVVGGCPAKVIKNRKSTE